MNHLQRTDVPDALKDSVKKSLKDIDRYGGILVVRSTLIGNDKWKGLTTKAGSSI